MAEHSEHPEHKEEPQIEQIADKIHFDRSSSSSSSDSDNETKPTAVWEPESSVKSKIWRIFGREKPVHHVFGGGKSADVFLWRNKKISASVLGGATTIWVFFEFLEYHLFSLVSHLLIFSLPILFLWSNATTFINKKRPHIPEVHLPEEPVLEIASALRIEINRALSVLREVASGRDLKKFLAHLYSSIQF